MKERKLVFCHVFFCGFIFSVWVWLTSLPPPSTYTPAPDLFVITYLRSSCPFSSPVCSIKVPALPAFSPRLLLDLGQAVYQINTMMATCDSPAHSRNVWSSVSLHSTSNVNHVNSADSFSFWNTFECVCSQDQMRVEHMSACLLCCTSNCYMI